MEVEPVWNGTFCINQGDWSETHQVQLIAKRQGLAIPSGGQLSFLSLVYCTQIPLHIVCGPAYELIAPRTWLHDAITNTLPSNTDDSEQSSSYKAVVESEIGALVRIEHEDGKRKHGGIEVTEFLVYASSNCESQLPFAALASGTLAPNQLARVRFFALPLSSHLLYDPDLYELPPTPPAEERSSIVEATVLQPLNFDRSRKRQRLNDLFHDAAKSRKKPVRQDSQDLTRLVPSRPQSPLLPFENEAETKASDRNRPARFHSRTQSLTSLHEGRPRSRGLTLERTRSSLSRVTSISTQLRPDSADNETCPPQEDQSSTGDKNRKALSSIVMAGMRMRGMSQKRRKDEELSSCPDDLEYKLVYHNTFKAASFALRNKSQDELSSETIREVVDVLLDLFCGNEGFDVTHEGFR